MKLADIDVLRQIDTLFPLRARLVTRHNGDKGRFDLTDANGNAVLIEGVSALRIIALLRLHNYSEAFEEIAAFDGELVFSKPVTRAVRSIKRPYNEMDEQPPFSYFF